MKRQLENDFRIGFPQIVVNSYKNCRNLTVKGENFIFPFVRIKSKSFGDKFVSLPFVDTTSFFGDYSGKDLLKALDSFDNKEKIEIRISLADENFKKIDKTLLKKGFKKEITKGHLVSVLLGEREMWKKFHKHTRNDIRKAKKSGLEIKEIDSLSELEKFYKLYSIQMKGFGTPQHSFSFFKEFFWNGQGGIFGMNCYFSDKLVGSIIIFYGGNYAYVFSNVSDPEYRNLRPNDFLYWEAIKICILKKIEFFDMGQIDINPEKDSREEGLLKFKKKWLGKEYQKASYMFNMNGIQEKKDSLKRFRNIWRKLPKFLTNYLGPKICSQLGN